MDVLSDGRWHVLEEIRQRVKVDDVQLQRITDFLKEYDFIVKDEAENRIKLNKIVQEFLAETATA
ncbi:MAG: hypothetical protein WBV70_01715 [Candidatus Bathyarchaeia archaeon]